MTKPTRSFYEFFAGGGMARIALEQCGGWRCALANDIDAHKCATYRDNFGDTDLIEGDVASLKLRDLPGRADLAWASFPCQDLSLAGGRRGMDAARSGAFWPFWRLMEGLGAEGRAPRAIVIENVSGLLTSGDGKDFTALCDAVASAGYRFSAHIIDAAAFLPQSRPRLFVIAWRGPAPVQEGDLWSSPRLERALAALPSAPAAALSRLRLPAPPVANTDLAALLEKDPADVGWAPQAKVAQLCAMMSVRQRAKLDAAVDRARRDGVRQVGAAFRRMRPDGQGGAVQRLEARWDVAGCLRTPAGGSSRQSLLIAEPDGAVRARLISGREAARLMGVPNDYRLPNSHSRAIKVAGDGVAVPVARFIAEHALSPILARLDHAKAPTSRARGLEAAAASA